MQRLRNATITCIRRGPRSAQTGHLRLNLRPFYFALIRPRSHFSTKYKHIGDEVRATTVCAFIH